MKANYTEQPPVLQNQNNGSWLYNYDIVQVPASEDRPESWDCSQILIWAEVTKKKVKKAIIEEEYPNDLQQKLVNDYHAFLSGDLTEGKYKMNYEAFNRRRIEVREMVNSDINVPVIE